MQLDRDIPGLNPKQYSIGNFIKTCLASSGYHLYSKLVVEAKIHVTH